MIAVTMVSATVRTAVAATKVKRALVVMMLARIAQGVSVRRGKQQ